MHAHTQISYFNYTLVLTETSQPLVQNTAVTLWPEPDLDSLSMEEKHKVYNFMSQGCGCSTHHGPCSKLFSFEYYYDFRSQCTELTHGELDMAILGQLSAFVDQSEQNAHSLVYHHFPAARKRTFTHFYHNGHKVCRTTFLFLHNISAARFKNLKTSFLKNGLAPRQHGNTKHLPANTLAYTDTENVVHYLTSYAEANAILLPGCIPGYKCSDVQLLPSSTTKRQVWLGYCACLQSSDSATPARVVAYSTFCGIWQRILPQILVTKPMSDLCWICQSNSIAIMRSANRPEAEKSEVKKIYTMCIGIIL